VAVLAALVSSLASVVAARKLGLGGSPAAGQAAAVYQCPMHPSVVQDHPGDCPICGMKLVKVDKPKPSAPVTSSAPKVLFYRSPMDPKQTSATPRKDEMGMDYLPVYEGEATSDKVTVPGLSAVEIDPARQQLIGLKTSPVEVRSVGGAFRTVGRVAVDETRVRHVNVKVPAFVERIYVDYIGKKVNKGDPLFSLYSPELLSTQEEYLLALKTRDDLAKLGSSRGDDNDLVAAARRKLELWDIPAAEMDRIERTRTPTKTLTLRSPATGVVTKKDVVEGMKLDAGAMPYEIVDLSVVWVLADVYENELRLVKEGMAANLTLAAFPNREFKGKVVFLDPLLDPQTRTVKVRITFPNPTGELRPEMFGEVVLLSAPHEANTIPLEAVIDSGTEKIAFVAIGEGKFVPRVLKIGQNDGTRVEVVSGLTLGEQVVTHANFLVDSESRLRASLATVTHGVPSAKPVESARVLPATAPAMPSEQDHAAHGHDHGASGPGR
ncbi:MAG TPA: efflux RND transporter periplasmic adaptor subunit, partial [Polyangiaceae bacterium]|nr:efflux RND transporter periplasmic adaptor subunit [Polyangiaceae bacterium]